MTTEGQTDIIDPTDVRALVVDSPLVRYATEKMQSMAIEEIARAKQDTALLQRTGAKWVTDATPEQLATFVRAAVSVGLNVLVGDAFLIHGGLFVSIQGRRKLAGKAVDRHDDTVLRGESPPRALTDAEFTLHGVHEGDVARIIDVFRADWDAPAQGIGIVRKKEIKPGGYKPVEDRPELMAAKRAAAMAYRIAFPDLATGTAEFDDGGRLVANDVTGVEIVEAVAAPTETPALPEGESYQPTPEERITQHIKDASASVDDVELVLGCSIAIWLAESDEEQALSLVDDLTTLLTEQEGMELAEAVSRIHAARAAAGLYYRADAITDNAHMSEAAAQPKLPD